jgi:hypothetical protein
MERSEYDEKQIACIRYSSCIDDGGEMLMEYILFQHPLRMTMIEGTFVVAVSMNPHPLDIEYDIISEQVTWRVSTLPLRMNHKRL